MENYLVSARKYRPTSFDTLVGQYHITSTLKNAIKQNKIAHAYLFCGPRGIGKTTCARILSKTINCESQTAETEACNQCNSCLSFNRSQSLNIYELDAASNNSVDDIRSLVDQVRYVPQTGKYKIYIIDEVHMLSTAAFNAFLKTLEEPPHYAIFILATTEKHKILPTILSRCQIFDFNRIKVKDISDKLSEIAILENIKTEYEALHLIATKADGAMRDALSIFDQLSAFTSSNITYQEVVKNLNILDYDYFFRLTDFLFNELSADVLLLFDEILQKGFEGLHLITGICEHLRDLLVCKDSKTAQLLQVPDSIKLKYIQQSATIDTGFILSLLNILNQCELSYKTSHSQRLHVEIALMKSCYLKSIIHASKQQITPVTEIKKKVVEVPNPTQNPPSPPTLHTSNLTPQTSSPTPLKFKNLDEISNLVKNNVPDSTKTEKTTTEIVHDERFALLKPEEIKEKIYKYAETLLQKGDKNEYVLLTSYPVEIGEKELILPVDNRFQEEKFKILRPDLIVFLKNELNLKNLIINTRVIEQKENKIPYTAKEKFDYMSAKFPYLIDLKIRLGLEFEY